jgi:hypothetical protein
LAPSRPIRSVTQFAAGVSQFFGNHHQYDEQHDDQVGVFEPMLRQEIMLHEKQRVLQVLDGVLDHVQECRTHFPVPFVVIAFVVIAVNPAPALLSKASGNH